jgi:hypothetical protein
VMVAGEAACTQAVIPEKHVRLLHRTSLFAEP